MLWLILACIGLLCMPLIAGFVYGLWEKRDRIREIRRANRESKKEETRAYFERLEQRRSEMRAREAERDRQARGRVQSEYRPVKDNMQAALAQWHNYNPLDDGLAQRRPSE